MPLYPVPGIKSSYHPYLLLGFYLGILPADILDRIPSSTRHDWKHKNAATLYGYDWYLQNQSSFTVMQQVFNNKRLLKINTALIRIIALQRFMQQYQVRIKAKIGTANAVTLDNIAKITDVLPVTKVLKLLQLPYARYLKMRSNNRCSQSIANLCRFKHPSQLLSREVGAIKQYCTDHRWQYWPLSSVYHQMIRDKAAACTLSTFYKYVRLMKLQRVNASHRRKNHHIRIRASKPLQLLHADATIIKTLDNVKNYVYLVQDNYSRAILAHRVSLDCKAAHVFENLRKAKEHHLKPNGIERCQLITDDGAENKGMVATLINSQEPPVVQHLIAQLDIEYSNSMIEALNKQLKYRFLYHQKIADHEALLAFLEQAVEDYNNRPQSILNGLTPLEVLHGQPYDLIGYHQQITFARANRMEANKKMACCHSFWTKQPPNI